MSDLTLLVMSLVILHLGTWVLLLGIYDSLRQLLLGRKPPHECKNDNGENVKDG